MEKPSRPLISALVTTFNEEQNIGECIESILWADEVIVVDSFSTDRTVEIVRKYPTVKLFERRYYGAASQKNWAMDQTTHPWIFIIDADERVTPELRDEILRLLERGPDNEAYIVNRQVYFMDKRLRFSGWQHDRVVRLIRRGAGRYPNKRVHADMKTECKPTVLKYSLIHYMIESFDQYLPRIVNYGFWGAGQGWKTRKRAGVFEVFIRPIWRFLRMYVFQGGFLDGMHGLVFCMLQSFGTYLKWAILWEFYQNAKRGRQPALPPFDEDDSTWEVKE
ncbi:MAG TPA: glycosyltransferase family 2 protein [Thermoanaerobaculia bacterium]|nr:glycosyltransferase family 2 protein [Thermoanaerobaculia bacterium]HUM29805.1 glycosyltransferase family 2 protein [Thermoanaerobaculia bacterium]HXK68080.1 glycosyltransferase family 2 protein [Thermoanaerobaculia bacterium]